MTKAKARRKQSKTRPSNTTIFRQWSVLLLMVTIPLALLFLWVSFVCLQVLPLASSYPQQRWNRTTNKPEIVLHKKQQHTWIHLNNIATTMRQAVILAEDARFYQHWGFDFLELEHAVKLNLAKKRYARGASTITQQVAKNLFLTQEKSLLRKVQEACYTLALELILDKATILTIYFNIAQWGPELFGIHAAAKHYFDKHPRQLNVKESAFLAVLLPSPVRYAISFRKGALTPFMTKQITHIVDKMVQTGRIRPEDVDSLLQTPLSFELDHALPQELYPHDIDETPLTAD